MALLNIISDYGFLALASLIVLSFCAGFIDAVIGGGGLIQLPALLINFPKTALPVLFGTNKIASLAGTSMAAIQYSRKIKFNYTLLFIIALSAAIASYGGARVVSYINVHALKPVILIILISIAVYTFIKKDLGAIKGNAISIHQQLNWGVAMGITVGFYDGFSGPVPVVFSCWGSLPYWDLTLLKHRPIQIRKLLYQPGRTFRFCEPGKIFAFYRCVTGSL